MYSVCYTEFFDILQHIASMNFWIFLVYSWPFPIYFWLETAKYILFHLKSQIEVLKYIQYWVRICDLGTKWSCFVLPEIFSIILAIKEKVS